MPRLHRNYRPEQNSPKPIEYIRVFGGDFTKLDISHKYEYRDRSENFWRFTFEAIAGEEGWFAWVRRPDSEEYFCVGKITEAELMSRLKDSPPPLTKEDDLIDLELWMSHGGLDVYTPKKKRRRKKDL